MHNEHNSSIPSAVITEVEDLLKQALAKLEPYRTPLTVEERKEMALVGDKTIAFLEKGKEYTDLYPELIPAWSDKKDFITDFDDVRNLTSIRSLADQVQESLYNIYYLAGNEAYHWMLDFYHSVKQAAGRDVPNAKIVADDLGKRFKSQGKKSSKPTD
jgi:hypothetical protein